MSIVLKKSDKHVEVLIAGDMPHNSHTDLGRFHGISVEVILGESYSGKTSWLYKLLFNDDPHIVNFDYNLYTFWNREPTGTYQTPYGTIDTRQYPNNFIQFLQEDKVNPTLKHLHSVHIYDDPQFKKHIETFITHARHDNTSIILILHDINMFDKLTSVKANLTDIHVTYKTVKKYN